MNPSAPHLLSPLSFGENHNLFFRNNCDTFYFLREIALIIESFLTIEFKEPHDMDENI